MTALTARLNHSATADPAFLRGMILGVIASTLIAVAIAGAVLLATWRPAPANAPAVQQPTIQIQVDQEHPLRRPGGVTVY